MHKYDKRIADGSYLLYPREMLRCDICFHNFISIVENLDYHKYYDLKNKHRYYHSVQKTFGQWREIESKKDNMNIIYRKIMRKDILLAIYKWYIYFYVLCRKIEEHFYNASYK